MLTTGAVHWIWLLTICRHASPCDKVANSATIVIVIYNSNNNWNNKDNNYNKKRKGFENNVKGSVTKWDEKLTING